jgi:hypothetical protein
MTWAVPAASPFAENILKTEAVPKLQLLEQLP